VTLSTKFPLKSKGVHESPDIIRVDTTLGTLQESRLRLDTGAPSGYLDPYLQVFSDKNPYLDLQGSFPTVHLDPQVFYLQVTGQQVLKVPTGIQ